MAGSSGKSCTRSGTLADGVWPEYQQSVESIPQWSSSIMGSIIPRQNVCNNRTKESFNFGKKSAVTTPFQHNPPGHSFHFGTPQLEWTCEKLLINSVSFLRLAGSRSRDLKRDQFIAINSNRVDSFVNESVSWWNARAGRFRHLLHCYLVSPSFTSLNDFGG